ncbi:MAG: F-box protein, partial [archaeon]|nr:F-box protein [archaeon]
MNKTARSLVDQGHVVFETLSRFSEWLRELPPCFFGESVLPDELILRIFSFLTPTELLKASLVSKTWRKIALDKYFWASFLINSRAIDPIAYKFSCLQQRCSSVARKPVRFYMASLKQAGSLRTQAVEMATIKPSSAMEVTAFDGGGGPWGQIVAFAATT